MDIRQQIIDKFSEFSIPEGRLETSIDKLHSCLMFSDETEIESNLVKLDFWLRGCIESLFYRPNKNTLVLIGEQGIGKSQFLRRLTEPSVAREPYTKGSGYSLYNEGSNPGKQIHIDFIYNYDIDTTSEFNRMCKLAQSDNFTVRFPYSMQITTDKRLVSICSTANVWNFPQRKSVFVLKLKEIKWDVYNSIDKSKLWKELFCKYKIN